MSGTLPEVLLADSGIKVGLPGEWAARRQEVRHLLEKEFFGFFPEGVTSSWETVEEDPDLLGGKATGKKIRIRMEKGEQKAEFDFQLAIPKGEGTWPCFLHLHFMDRMTGIAEELVDEGFAIAHVNYNDIEKDISEERFDGVQGFSPEKSESRWGKFGCWAFGVSRIVDVLKAIPNLGKITLVGHSRLAMTALWAGASDERIDAVAAIQSGGLYRGTQAETFHDLSREYTKYWFCPSLFQKYASEEGLPFDMHFLLALIAPRPLFLDGATRDLWCDPKGLYRCGQAVSPVYRVLGVEGLVGPEEPEVGAAYLEGSVGYYLREGTHYLGRDDWHQLIRFLRRHDIA